MEYRDLGQTGIRVSRICYGSLTLGPLQRNLSPAQGGELIRRALWGGINFIDTAEIYRNYPHIAHGLKGWDARVIVATKTYAYTREGARKSVEQARRELNREVVDIFLLHEQESALTLQGHRPALEYLWECREKGTIRAVGISTHYIGAVKAAAREKEIDVVSPLMNVRGLGIRDGGREEMAHAVGEARKRGKGIYLMKPLAGGHLMGSVEEALAFSRDFAQADAVALGMGSRAEVDYALYFMEGKPVPREISRSIGSQKRRLIFTREECLQCGACREACPQDALGWDGGLAVREEECILCGYCGSVCPTFCLRII